MVKCRVILVGASGLFLEGLSLTLKSDDLTVLHTVTALELLPLLAASDETPDLLVWDSSADVEQDLPRWEEVHAEFPQIGIVALGDQIDDSYAARAIAAGVRALLPRCISTAALSLSLQAMACAASVTLIPFNLAPGRQRVPAVASATDPGRMTVPLSTREAEILQCLGTGAPNKVIARDLDLAEATIKVHIKTLLRKINVRNRTQAAIWSRTHQFPGWKSTSHANRPHADGAYLQSAE